MSAIFVYRNCFTGDVSGGDMHTGGVCDWISGHYPEHPLYLVHAADDGQAQAYKETAQLREITYPGPKTTSPALMFPLRAMKANKTSLPWHPTSNLFVAGSHFIPDVWPVLGQGKKAPGGIRAVYIHHIIQDMPRPRNLNTFMANIQERFTFDLIKYHFDKIITVNKDVVQRLRELGFTQPIMLSSNFVNTHTAQPKPYAKKDYTLAFCGRMVVQKGVDDFLDICETVQQAFPGFKAVMIGAGPELDRLKASIKERGLRVELTGFVSDEKKFDLVSRAKLTVMPSVEEGWGIAIAESLSVGTPVLAYDLPVYQEPFGKAIQVVPLHDKKQLSDQAVQLLTIYKQDPVSYAAIQKTITTHAQAFSRDEIANKEFAFLMGGQHG